MELTSEQIQILLIEKITGRIDPQDDEVIEQLLAESEDVRQQWLALNLSVQQAEGFTVDVSEEERWQKLKPLLQPHRPTWKSAMSNGAKVAAVLLAVMVGLYFLLSNSSTKQAAENPESLSFTLDDGKVMQLQTTGTKTVAFGSGKFHVTPNELACLSFTGSGRQWGTVAVPNVLDYKVRLSDGTEVWLNSKTSIRFPLAFSGPTREVYISGEAYFKVARNPRQPFIVHTPKTDVTVTGTQFNVNTYNDDEVETALVEGSVVTKSAGSESVALKPGFRAVYNAQSGFRTETFEETDVLSWMKGVYYFHNTPLRDLADVLSRWYGTRIRFENAASQNKTFTGELIKRQPLQIFLDNLKLSADVNASVQKGVVYFH